MSTLAPIEQYQLSAAENDRRVELEGIIRAGLETFYAVGNALAEIREQKLYRSTHETFEEYCRAAWSMSKTHANRLIQAAEVVASLPADLPAPATESQARELANIADIDERGRVWATVNNGSSKPTASGIREARTLQQFRDEYKDLLHALSVHGWDLIAPLRQKGMTTFARFKHGGTHEELEMAEGELLYWLDDLDSSKVLRDEQAKQRERAARVLEAEQPADDEYQAMAARFRGNSFLQFYRSDAGYTALDWKGKKKEFKTWVDVQAFAAGFVPDHNLTDAAIEALARAGYVRFVSRSDDVWKFAREDGFEHTLSRATLNQIVKDNPPPTTTPDKIASSLLDRLTALGGKLERSEVVGGVTVHHYRTRQGRFVVEHANFPGVLDMLERAEGKGKPATLPAPGRDHNLTKAALQALDRAGWIHFHHVEHDRNGDPIWHFFGKGSSERRFTRAELNQVVAAHPAPDLPKPPQGWGWESDYKATPHRHRLYQLEGNHSTTNYYQLPSDAIDEAFEIAGTVQLFSADEVDSTPVDVTPIGVNPDGSRKAILASPENNYYRDPALEREARTRFRAVIDEFLNSGAPAARLIWLSCLTEQQKRDNVHLADVLWQWGWPSPIVADLANRTREEMLEALDY